MNLFEYYDRIALRKFAVIDIDWNAQTFCVAVRKKVDPNSTELSSFEFELAEYDMNSTLMRNAMIVYDLDAQKVLKNRVDMPIYMIRRLLDGAEDHGILIPKGHR